MGKSTSCTGLMTWDGSPEPMSKLDTIAQVSVISAHPNREMGGESSEAGRLASLIYFAQLSTRHHPELSEEVSIRNFPDQIGLWACL